MSAALHRLTVAAVIERDGSYLLVQERIGGRLVLNQPAGHVESGESVLAAVVREALEETGRCFTPDSVVGIYRWQPPHGDRPYLRVAFAGTCGEPLPGRRLDAGIEGTAWYPPAALAGAGSPLRSPMVLRTIADHRTGRLQPLATVTGLELAALLELARAV